MSGLRSWLLPVGRGLAGLQRCRPGGQEAGRAWWCLPPGNTVFLVKDWKSNAFHLLLILADNYNLTTNNFTTETQSAQRTHRGRTETFSRAICCMLTACDPCGTIDSSAGQLHRPLVVRLCSLPPHVVRAVRACGDVVQAGPCMHEQRMDMIMSNYFRIITY